MSEPITLHDGAGNTLTVYTRSQAEGLLSGGQWFATEAEAQAAHPAPLVTTGAIVSSGTGETDAAPTKTPTKTKRPSKGKGL
jgi:hypothetical protein